MSAVRKLELRARRGDGCAWGVRQSFPAADPRAWSEAERAKLRWQDVEPGTEFAIVEVSHGRR